MLKDKEVISDPQRQYEIARSVHNQAHGGINKTTATIAERYHWSRIKETVSDVIRNCSECKDTNKTSSAQNHQPSPGTGVNGLKRPNPNAASSASACKRASPSPSTPGAGIDFAAAAAAAAAAGAQRSPPVADPSHMAPFNVPAQQQYADPSAIAISILPPPSHHHPLPSPTDTAMTGHDVMSRDTHEPMLQQLHPHHHPPTAHPVTLPHTIPVPDYQPIDPQIIAQSSASADLHHHSHTHEHSQHHYSFSQPSPPPSHHQQHDHPHHDLDADADAETFQALLNAAVTDDDEEDANGSQLAVGVSSAPPGLPRHDSGDDRERGNIPSPGGPVTHTASMSAHHDHQHQQQHHHHPPPPPPPPPEHTTPQPREGTKAELEEEDEAVDRDLEMLIESQEDDEPLPAEHEDPELSGKASGRGDALAPVDVEMDIGAGGDTGAAVPVAASSGKVEDVAGSLAGGPAQGVARRG
ncbi:hypothetical protein L209DRAFT_386427 [Thermothelomyces heterothallicus CBS 203.75]